MRKTFGFIIKAAIAGGLAIVILSVINIPYFYTGIHIDNETGATDYIWESGQIRTNMTEGYAWLTMDRYGFNNTDENAEKSIQEGVDILIMGSSHMEAMEVAEDENLGYLLNERLSDKNTYNIGISGHNIYRIMDNVSDAVKTYEPKDYVIIETSAIELDEEKMMAVVDGTAKKIPSYDSGIVYQLQKIPAIKWLYKSLEEWMSQSKGALGNLMTVFAAESEIKEIPASYAETLDAFLNMSVQACEETGCTPVIFYHQQADIQADGTINCNTDEQYLELFAKTCEKQGIIFIDMTESLIRGFEEEHILPHGFMNTYVGSGHINAYGHRMVADKLLEVIYKE